MQGLLLGKLDEESGAICRRSAIYRVNGDVTTRELGQARPRPEGPSTTQTAIRSLTPEGFVGGGSEGGGRQDPISAEITWWGLMLMWPKIFSSLTNKKLHKF
jgi:hypothetical protein